MTERVRCPLCLRMILPENLTRHHTVPKSRGGRVTEPVCRTCHDQIHAMFTEKQLEREMPDLGSLRAHPDFATYLRWVRRKNPDKRFCVRRRKER